MKKLLKFVIRISIVGTVFLIPLAWNPFTFEAFEFSKQYVLLFLVLLGVLSWFFKMIFIDREVCFKRTPLDLPIIFFVFAALLSSLFSADVWSSLFGYYGRFSNGLFSILSCVGLYLLIINNIQKPSSLVRPFLISSAIAVFVGYLSFFGVFQQFSSLAPIMQQVGFNTVAQSIEGFSIFLAFLISFLLLYSVRPTIQQLPFAGNLLLLFSSFGLLLLTDVSKAWIVLFFGLLFVLFAGLFQRTLTGETIQLKRLWLPAVFLFFCVVFLFSSVAIPGLKRNFHVEPMLSAETSFDIAVKSVTENAKNLLLGSGVGTFALDFSKHRSADFNTTSQWQTRFDRSGNHITEVLSTIGILGFISYLGLLIWFFLVSLVFLKDRKNFPFVLGVLVLLICQLVYYQTTVLQVAFWLFLGLSAVSFEFPKKEFKFSLKSFPEFEVAAKAVCLIFLFATGAVLFFATRFFIADANYLVSQNISSSNPVVRIEKGLKAISLNPWQAEYKIFLSRLYLGRAKGELLKPENLRDQEQISRDVQYAIAYTRGDTVQCAALSEMCKIEGATELSPNRVATWETLGAVYRDIKFASGALDWGISSFETAINLEPSNSVLYTELGKLQVVKEEFLKARDSFEKAVKLKPDYVDPQLQLALLFEKEGDTAAALKAIKEVSVRYPLYVDGTFQYGRLLYNQAKVEEAILQFEQVVKIAPNNSNAMFALGVAYEKQGMIEKAKEQFKKVLELNPGNQQVQEKLQQFED